MKNLGWPRFQAASGILFALSGGLPLVLLPPPPVFGASAREIMTYYTTYGGIFVIVTYLGIVSIGFFLIFLAYLRTLLKQPGEPTLSLAALALCASAIWATIFLIFSGLILSFPSLAVHVSNATLLQALSDLTDTGFAANYIPSALLISAAALALMHNASIPRWISLSGLAIALLQLLASLSLIVRSGLFSPAGFIYNTAFAAFVAWILVLSIFLSIQTAIRAEEMG